MVLGLFLFHLDKSHLIKLESHFFKWNAFKNDSKRWEYVNKKKFPILYVAISYHKVPLIADP